MPLRRMPLVGGCDYVAVEIGGPPVPAPAFSQVRGLEPKLRLGAPRRIRTFDLPLRRRSLYPLSYRGRCPAKLSAPARKFGVTY